MSTPFAPIRVRTLTSRRRVEASAFDCVRFVVVRDGSFLIDCASQVEPIGMGDVVVVAPPTVVGYEPEGNAIVTTLFADTDYLIEHLFLQHLDLIPDRDAARDLAAKLYPDPVQVLHLGEREVERLGPVLDELVSRTEATQDAAGYFRTQAHLLTVLEAVALHVHHAPVAVPLMRSDITRRWRLDDLAAHVCLSPSLLPGLR